MAQYANLKDYFQNEHIRLIQDAISNYMKDDPQITDAVVRSLVCTDDDAKYNAEFDLGVSVKTVGAAETADLSFIVTVRGNIEQRFRDIQVKGVKRVSSDMFPEDNILSQFILPDIQSDDVERIGNDLYGFCAGKGLFVNYKLHIEKLVSDGMIYFAPLPNNCLGRVILSEADVEIIKNVQTEDGLKPKKCTIRATHGTILLNYKKYAEERDGGLRITVAHELVHTMFHSRFLKLLQMLGEEKVDLHSTTETIALKENMSDIQKALRIAESQADVLAMALAIPKSTVDVAIQEIATDPSTHYANYGDRIQACVNKFAKLYGVSAFIAKDRLRQLGYDFVDGTCLEYEENGRKIHPTPFYFQPRTLKGNETFVIDRNNYERLLRENSDFADLINSGRYVYLGYVVCQLEAEYIDVVSDEDDIRCVLSEYARENANKCLLKFRFRNEKASNQSYYYNASYLNKIPEYNEIIPESFELCEEDTGLDSTTVKQIKEYNDTMNMLNSPKLKNSLANTVIYYMQEKNIEDYDLYKKAGITHPALIKIYQGETKKPGMKTIMGLCIGLELENEECYDMFEKAGYNIREDTLRNRAYRFLFSCTRSDLQECNKILRYFKQDELPIRE